jgi:hypothetical protein
MRLSGTKGAWFCRFLAHSSLKLGHLEKGLEVVCSSTWPLTTLQISAKTPHGSPRNSRSREVFLFFIYGHQRCPYIRLSGPAMPLFGQNIWLEAPSNDIGAEQSWDVFWSPRRPLYTQQFSAKSLQGSPRNSRSREVFFSFSFFSFFLSCVTRFFSLDHLPEK